MFGPPGHAYVYFTYGMHWCCNVVVEPAGDPAAVLIRALRPLSGLDEMRTRRGPAARSGRDLCSGPAKLCQALGIDRDLDGHDLTQDPLLLLDDGTPPPTNPSATTRIGLSKGKELPWRWCVADDANVSR